MTKVIHHHIDTHVAKQICHDTGLAIVGCLRKRRATFCILGVHVNPTHEEQLLDSIKLSFCCGAKKPNSGALTTSAEASGAASGVTGSVTVDSLTWPRVSVTLTLSGSL